MKISRLGTFTALTIAGLVVLNLAACTANARSAGVEESAGVSAQGYVGYTPKADPETTWKQDLEVVEKRYKIEIGVKVTQEGDSRNCGAMAAASGMGGCFQPTEPNKIYVSDGLGPELTKFVILHEAAHAVMHSRGWPQNECRADEFAVAWGAELPKGHIDCEDPARSAAPAPTSAEGEDGVYLNNEDESTYEELSDADIDELELDGEENRNK